MSIITGYLNHLILHPHRLLLSSPKSKGVGYVSIFKWLIFVFFALLNVAILENQAATADSIPIPISWWQGEGNANDETGLNNGTLENGVVFAPGKVGQALSFDGTGSYVLIGDIVPSSLQIQNEITLEAWIYATKYPINNLGLIVGSQYDVTASGATIFLDGRENSDFQPSPPGHIHFQIGDGTWHTTNTNSKVPLNQWVHIVATRKANEDAKIYYNGVLQPSTSVPWVGTISYNGAWFAIGQQKDLYRPFNGLIDEVKIYNYALSSEEVLAEYEMESKISIYGTLGTSSNYDFTIDQSTTDNTESIQLFNPSNIPHSATLEIENPYLNLGIYVTPDQINISPGETNNIPISLDASSIVAGVYDGILLKILVDDGSIIYSNIKIYVTPQGATSLPDLAISSSDFSSIANSDGTATLATAIHNQGAAPASNIQVQFYDFDNLLGTAVVDQVPSNGIGSASITVFSGFTSGDHLIRVVIDPSGDISELDKTNNESSKIVRIGAISPRDGNILVTGSLPSTVYAGSSFAVTGQAVYAININGTTNMDYVVQGGAMLITVSEDGGSTWVYGDIHTDTNGNFSKYLQAPDLIGTYHISMTVTDQTFSGTRELVFSVIPAPAPGSLPPPSPPVPTSSGAGNWTYVPSGTSGTWMWTWTTQPTESIPDSDLRIFSENIHFSNNNPVADEEITLFAEIYYWATSTASVAHNVPVNIYITYPGSPRVKIGQTVIDSLSVANPDNGARYVYATWKNTQGEGIYIVEVEIDPSYVETNLLNNAATRAIVVGQLQSGLGAISGQITDSLNGVGGVTIHILNANGAEIGSTITDQTGFYLVKNVPLGGLQVHIDPPSGYQPDAGTKPVTVYSSQMTAVNFLLTRQVDTTSPIVTPTINGILGNNGWYTSDVTVRWEVTDTESDVTFTDGCETTTVSTDTAGVTFTCSATSEGGTAKESVTVKRDATPPTITGSASPAANANSWRNSPVMVSFSCTDAMSGITTCADTQTLSSEGANQSASGTATDQAGNSASTQVTGINIDLTPPTVRVMGVTDGAIYTGTAPPADCETTDALSGVQTFATVNVTGGDANGLGTFVARCAGAMDKAGNAGATVSVSYQVIGTVGPINTGALTIGFWRNKNGQALITGGASSGGVCNSGVWLRQYAPYQDLSAMATCSQVGTYVTNLINAANASGSSMNPMLKAQMLATALSVYFSDPSLGGNRIAAPAPVGGVSIDLTHICNMIDVSSGTATCSGVYQDVGGAFGGATSLTVSQLLAHAAGQSNIGGSLWYGNVKATQELAKNTFDAINNRIVFAP